LAFNDLGATPKLRVVTSEGFPRGKQLLSSPFLLCDDEDLSLAAGYVDPAIRVRLVKVLQAASQSFQRFVRFEHEGIDVDSVLDDIIDMPVAANDVPGLLVETCALAGRIMRRTLSGDGDRLDDPENELDALAIYDNTRFIGLKAWTGLPYVYVWV
jgi:hypothetical protein